MYRKLQEKAKEYIVSSLSQLFDKWWFDIKFNAKDCPIIIGYGPTNLLEESFRGLHNHIIKKIGDNAWNQYEISGYDVTEWIKYRLFRQLVPNIFKIYGIGMDELYSQSRTIHIIKKDGTERITSYVCKNTDLYKNYAFFASPFTGPEIKKYILKEKLVSPLLLLLDPITYFRKYSIIIEECSASNDFHTLGIYELLLEYFPEMDGELVEKYWALGCIFNDLCTDIAFVIGGKLLGVYY